MVLYVFERADDADLRVRWADSSASRPSSAPRTGLAPPLHPGTEPQPPATSCCGR
jgi:hypothetical protein